MSRYNIINIIFKDVTGNMHMLTFNALSFHSPNRVTSNLFRCRQYFQVHRPLSVVGREISEEVTERWQRLVTCAEERHKLVTASLNFYKTAEQVCSVLDSLEREYRRDEDWCGSGGAPAEELALPPPSPHDKAAQVSPPHSHT